MYGKAQVLSPARNCTETDLFCKLVQTKFDELADLKLVIRIGRLVVAVCDDAAYRSGIMAKMSGNACDGRTFHLEVRYLQVSEAETLKLFDHIRHCKRHTQDSSLRAIETGSRYGHSRICAVTEFL